MKRADEIVPGDSFDYPYRDQLVPTVALRAPEPHTDVTGLPILRFWARRTDTGAEGWMLYGPAALIAVT